MLHPYIQSRLPQIVKTLKDNGVESAYIFGSGVTLRFNENSDVDILFSFRKGLDPVDRGEKWWRMFYSLKEILKKEIDLLTADYLTNPYLIESINRSKEKIL